MNWGLDLGISGSIWYWDADEASRMDRGGGLLCFVAKHASGNEIPPEEGGGGF